MVTVPSLFADNVASDPARPMLTWYSPRERTELSGATLANWIAKTANLLVDGCGLGPGDTAAVKVPPHWQTSSIMLGCWTAGLAIAHSESVTPDVSFGLDGTECDYVVSMHPLGMPGHERDWVHSARAHGDHYTGLPAPPDAPALVGLPAPVTHADLARMALARAKELGIGRGDRILINVDSHRRPMDWLTAPIAAGASVVLCSGIEPSRLDEIGTTEHVTVQLP